MKQEDYIKTQVQDLAYDAWVRHGRKGTIVAGTGFGKSRLYVRRVHELFLAGVVRPDNPSLLIVPTERLRDEN